MRPYGKQAPVFFDAAGLCLVQPRVQPLVPRTPFISSVPIPLGLEAGTVQSPAFQDHKSVSGRLSVYTPKMSACNVMRVLVSLAHGVSYDRGERLSISCTIYGRVSPV